MGFFDKLGSIIKMTDDVVNRVEDIAGAVSNMTQADNSTKTNSLNDIEIAGTSRMVQDVAYGENNYAVSFRLNDSFKEAKSHAGEIEMLYTYAPFSEYGEEDTYPYVAVHSDDKVYTAVKDFKQNGTFAGGIEITPLSDKFYFKAKIEYFGYMMYFYGMDRCEGSLENNGLCMVYPKSYVGTDNEKKLMNVLDEAAQSYCEIRE